MGALIPEPVLSAAVVITLFTIMSGLGLDITLHDLRWIRERPGAMLRGLLAVLVVAPVIAIAIARTMDVPRAAEIGIALMAISPGAPVSLQRSLAAGAHRAFAPSLQIAAVVAAVVSMPVSIALLDRLYDSTAQIEPWRVAWQVFIAQLLPLMLGIVFRRARPGPATSLQPRVARAGTGLLVVTVVLVLVDSMQATAAAGSGVLLAIAVVTVAALGVGHLLGGPEPAARTAVAITTAARNPGLALLVATRNDAPVAVVGTILAYLVVSVFTILPYTIWRGRTTRRTA